MKKLSVVVPVYNSEEYLSRCIESILQQTYNNLELILVDNGSRDQSLEICKEYARQDERILVLEEKKPGPSCARNKGLKEATGDYLAFVDSDDYLGLDFYKQLIQEMEHHECQMMIGGWRCHFFPSERERDVSMGVKGNKVISADLLRSVIGAEDIEFGGGFLWNRVIDLTSIRQHSDIPFFDESLTAYEDKLWLIKISKLMTQVGLSEYIGYHYIIHDDSLSHQSESTSKCEQFIAAWNMILTETADVMTDDIEFHYCDSILRMIYKMFRNGDNHKAKEYWQNYRKRIVSKKLYKSKRNIVKIITLSIRYGF